MSETVLALAHLTAGVKTFTCELIEVVTCCAPIALPYTRYLAVVTMIQFAHLVNADLLNWIPFEAFLAGLASRRPTNCTVSTVCDLACTINATCLVL